ncbi:basic proline-rich protein-like [Aquila chrysaetos chrysaetos]|uniref:basic proline-rich protein-like n=1 Tax=Aquila chrysaetos chrysaetos TaxID=223781 RepID=UPI0011772AF5|nr:basic proline-rich protein-like [Aquila chrysaetos chrysaetos]
MGLGMGSTSAEGHQSHAGARLFVGPPRRGGEGGCLGYQHPRTAPREHASRGLAGTVVAEGHGAGTAPPRPATTSTPLKAPVLLSHAAHPAPPPPRTHCWEPAATPGRVTVTPRRPAWPRGGGDPGPRRPSVGRGARRLPGPAENKVSSAPALTPGAICSGRAGLPGEPPAPPPPPPRGSRHPGATRRRLRPGTPSCPAPPPTTTPRSPFPAVITRAPPTPPGAGSPLAPPHRQPLRRAAPSTPNPNPAPGVLRDGGTRPSERHIPEHPDGCSTPKGHPTLQHPTAEPRRCRAGSGAVALRAAAPGPCARRQTKAITKAAAGPRRRRRRPGQVPPGVRGSAPAPAPLPPPRPHLPAPMAWAAAPAHTEPGPAYRPRVRQRGPEAPAAADGAPRGVQRVGDAEPASAGATDSRPAGDAGAPPRKDYGRGSPRSAGEAPRGGRAPAPPPSPVPRAAPAAPRPPLPEGLPKNRGLLPPPCGCRCTGPCCPLRPPPPPEPRCPMQPPPPRAGPCARPRPRRAGPPPAPAIHPLQATAHRARPGPAPPPGPRSLPRPSHRASLVPASARLAPGPACALQGLCLPPSPVHRGRPPHPAAPT